MGMYTYYTYMYVCMFLQKNFAFAKPQLPLIFAFEKKHTQEIENDVNSI